MSNILITGSNGFIGKSLRSLLSIYGHNIYEINRSVCDLLDPNAVTDFFDNSPQFDVVIHAAIQGGRRTKTNEPDIVFFNILMLYNLLAHKDKYSHLVSFGSGAEFDRRYNINKNCRHTYPIDPYGLSKNAINKIIDQEDKLSNFRIYNCFGVDEQPDRMIKNNILRYINKQPIHIHIDRKMDFFYIDDLAMLLQDCIANKKFPKTVDCCYYEKLSLLDIANKINNLDTHDVEIIIDNETESIGSSQNDYTGYYSYPLKYIGLDNALLKMYKELKK